MDSYKKIEISDNKNEYMYDYNFGISNSNTNIQQEYEKKVDILLDGILSNRISNIKIDELS